MARIRSIHPALFTDEAFASLSMAARVLLLGIWTEADDQGVFEWKPISLKMRLFPVDNVDVPALLAELETSNTIKSFLQDGRSLGAVRNFCKYQRPKTPKYREISDKEIRNYVASKYPITESAAPDPIPFPQKEEIGTSERRRIPKIEVMPPQREEGGGRRKEVNSEAKASAPSGANEITEASVFIFGKSLLGKSSGGQITNLKKMFKEDWPKVYSVLLQAEEKGNAAEWIAGVLRGSEFAEPTADELCPPEIYGNVL